MTHAAIPSDRCIRIWVLLAAIVASGMAIIDSTAVNVALPALTRDIAATEVEFLWIVDAYLLLLSALLLVGGVLGDMYGRRRIFGIGVALFTAASVWCGLAPDPLQLIAARALQGVGGALLVPGSLSILTANFPESERGKAIGWWSASSALMVALGPVLGGWFVDVATWRLVFFINVPLGLGVLWMLARYVPESRGSAAAGGIDWLGSALAVFGLGALVFGLIDGGKFGFDRPLASGAIVLGIVLLVAFVAAEARSANPMMPLSLFRSRNFSGANLLTVLLYAPLGGGTLFLPILMIEVYDYSAMLAGAAMLPVVVLLVTLSRFFGGLLPRTGATALLITGPLIAGAGWAYFSLPWFSGGYWTTFFPGFVLLGLGMAIVVAPLTTVVMTSFDDSKAGVASGINNAASRTAGLVAVALFGALVTVVFNLGLDARIAELMLPAGVSAALAAQENLMTAARIPAGLGDEMSLALENAIDQSLLAGVRAAMVLSAALAFASAAFAALMIRYKPAAGK